jgi:hypothetical protein
MATGRTDYLGRSKTKNGGGGAMDPNDVLLWPDAFWCFREEFRPEFLRGNNYREVAVGSEDWLKVTAPAAATKPSRR